ncbi:citrate lyase holo-[acyl-carrier protein] synthase [Companilactobacillus nuruki]|uniref:citrate lyase holo-[acyl-carrier protein] synthase n=1 Tax=Companilactobacillus nuruki TaxID=1993540 RepID=A0A2N7AVE7_9LACO|nr:citrate lyase holo-[acyl-carrier protein] synthase [Companilactobacillus nuruki]PMD72078.1 citrate lyase holo-[acyl-carrier protein] synthase [Companilactobacillus nuruki]
MVDVFSEGIKQDIVHVLKNRDSRVMEQQMLFRNLNKHQSLVSAKLNIPGPVKNNIYLAEMFSIGLKEFLKGMDIDYQLIRDVATGPEAFVIIEGNASSVKKTAIKFEDNNELGRLFDIDVLISEGDALKPLSRSNFNEPERKCLLCGKPAKVCARSRNHSVEEMQLFINKLINRKLEFSWN